jgi:hypothetical protein
MRRTVCIVLLVILFVGAGLLWLGPGGKATLFLNGLDWTTSADSGIATPAPSSGDTLEAFGLSGPASCRATEPPTNSPWLKVARADAEKYQLDPMVFVWKIWQESGFRTDAVSSAGAVGIAQFMPSTAAGMGIDPHDPEQSLDASARLDAGHITQNADRALQLAKHYGGSSARYGYALALAAYNAGPGNLNSAWNQAFAKSWPASPWAWLTLMGLETQHYIPNIMNCSVK